MNKSSPTGESPVCPKSVDRAKANHMGDSVRIAVKYMASEYSGHAIEPRNDQIDGADVFIRSEGSNIWYKGR